MGSGDNPSYPEHKLFIWDDQGHKILGELDFQHEITAVRIRKDK